MLKVGDTEIGSLYVGSTQIAQAYVGSTLVYPEETALWYGFGNLRFDLRWLWKLLLKRGLKIASAYQCYKFVLTDGTVFYAIYTSYHNVVMPGGRTFRVPDFTIMDEDGKWTTAIGLSYGYDAEWDPPFGQWLLEGTDIGEIVEDQTEAENRGSAWDFLDPQYWSQQNLIYLPPEVPTAIEISSITEGQLVRQ